MPLASAQPRCDHLNELFSTMKTGSERLDKVYCTVHIGKRSSARSIAPRRRLRTITISTIMKIMRDYILLIDSVFICVDRKMPSVASYQHVIECTIEFT